MALTSPIGPIPRTEPGNVQFVSQAELGELEASLGDQGWLVVKPSAPSFVHRGQLARWLEESIEQCLQDSGAPPPGVAASADLDGSLSDFLYRARAAGAVGLCVHVPPLLAVAAAGGALHAEDSALLRWWMTATTERPVRILIDPENRGLGVYGPPVLLQSLIDAGTEAWRHPIDHPRPTPASADDIEPVNPRPTPASADGPDIEPVNPRPTPASADGSAPRREDSPEPPALPEQQQPAAGCEHPPGETRHDPLEPTPTPVAPLYPDAADRWQGWARELENARGPKPLSSVERLFLSAYLPLLESVERGIADSSAKERLNGWATSFDRSYSDAFEALRWRSQRPTMVFDAPDLALRIARLHGARSVQLVLADGMRFDLGLHVNGQLETLLGPHAALTDQLLLWAALPSTTAVQLELLGRGPEGLKDLGSGNTTEVTVARGRGASTLRRVKVGARDLLKLDLIESRLSEPGEPYLERLHRLATDAAQALAHHILRLPPRTLVMVFGDHGFVLDSLDSGTSAARHGGARPEEVLVPAFAWLVGAVH